ncbi:MAG TPA: NADH-quinone oxidoreductase subunit N [Anaerolineales bacterium]|nr:NADH-quinone oxidoreductase subunit N [Anaerolineales bacterium]
MTNTDLVTILPVLILSAWACLLMLVDLFIPVTRKKWTAWLALAGLLAGALGLLSWPPVGYLPGFGGMVIADGFALFLDVVFLLSGALAVLLALNYLPRAGIERGEFYILLLFALAGMMLMAQAADLIVVFLALEMLSIPLYILSGFARPRPSSEESAMKYFLLGAFASGFLVYGIALVYGGSGSTNLAQVLAAAQPNNALILAGAALILVGLSFKVAAVPFHMWTPDVYDGAPSVVTAFMSVGAKAAGFAALLRVFVTAFPGLATQWAGLAAIVSALTMIVGNFAAIAQSNIKRMLAYSSIAHAGYILMGLVAAGSFDADLSNFSVGASIFYLLAYAFTNLGTWAIVIAVERSEGDPLAPWAGLALDDYAGLGARRPGLALAMALFMLSLTGLPPTVGFVAKFYVFRAAIDAGYLWLALVGVLTSLVSAYYYLRVVIIMYMREGEGRAFVSRALNFTVALTALATFVFGLLPGPLMALATNSVLGVMK